MRFVVRHRAVIATFVVLWHCFVFYVGKQMGTIESSEYEMAAQAAFHTLESTTTNLPKSSTYLVVMIMSSPDGINERQISRETWINAAKSIDSSEVRFQFPIGTKELSENAIKKLKAENEEFKDLLFIDKLVDSFDNLTKKTAFAIEAAVKFFDFRFILKTDTDSYVRVGHLLKALRDIENPRLYWGFMDGRAKPFRRGKYKESGYVLCDRYLPYQLGGGYVLSATLAKFISANIPLLRFYRSEDVSVGVWLSAIQTKYVHDPRFDTEYISRGCNNRYLITHKHTPKQMRDFAINIQNTGNLCKKEFQSRPSYIYDFSVPPSQCCTRVNGSKIP